MTFIPTISWSRRRATVPCSTPSGSIRNPALSLGILLGIGFSGTGLTWLLLANRVPQLEPFASERNLALAIAFSLLGLVPSCRFMKFPGRSFRCGIIACAIFTTTYFVTELRFPRLATRLTAFHLFILGGVAFGFLAVLAWVMNLVAVLSQGRQHTNGQAQPIATAMCALPTQLNRQTVSEIARQTPEET